MFVDIVRINTNLASSAGRGFFINEDLACPVGHEFCGNMSEEEVNAWKIQFPKPMREAEGSGVPEIPDSHPHNQIFQDLVDKTIHHVLFDESKVLVNTLCNLIKESVDELIAQRIQLKGENQ